MRKWMPVRFALGATMLVAMSLACRAQEQAASGSAGDEWTLVGPLFGESVIMTFRMEEKDGNWKGTFISGQSGLEDGEFSVDQRDGQVRLEYSKGAGTLVFVGSAAQGLRDNARIRGSLQTGSQIYPAWLQPREAGPQPALQPEASLMEQLGQIVTEGGAETAAKLREFISAHAGHPTVSIACAQLILRGDQDGLNESDVRQYVDKCYEAGQPYGEGWVEQCHEMAIDALSQLVRNSAGDGKSTYAAVFLSVAADAEKQLSTSASTQKRADAAKTVIAAAEAAGDATAAGDARRRWEEVEILLDEEYHANVPPFEPEKFAGRTSSEHDRTVLLELFTGAQCPPCVASDVAFDALLGSFQPTELVSLQYHLHIPGPDPMTSADSIARAQYYAVQGTPSTYLNGRPAPPGGGYMETSPAIYEQFRQTIMPLLADTKQATIQLDVQRTGNNLHLTVDARADAPADDADRSQRLRLRLALTQSSVRYVGRNHVRFHHHVVRAMPEGPEGATFKDDSCQITTAVDLDELQSRIDATVEEFAKVMPIDGALPSLDVNALHVVAFVQDEHSKEVLHAVTALVPASE